MAIKFTKMHGLGNDYIYVNCFEESIENPSELAVVVSDRHTGIGGDGLILICPSDVADVRMRMFNADGTESEMCGNGIRCVAKYVYDHKVTEVGGEFSVPGQGSFEALLRVETGRGVLTLGLVTGTDDTVEKVCVNMGQPILVGDQIPVAIEGERIVNEAVEVGGAELLMTCVSMGNPHAVFFCDDVEAVELEKIGPLIENHELFPQRVNTHFVKIEAPGEFTMRT